MHPDAQKASDYYDAHVGARRQLYSSQRLTDRLAEPSILLSAFFIALGLLYNFWGHPVIENTLYRLWDAWVSVTPAGLIETIEDWRFPRLAPRPMEDHIKTHAAKSEAMRKIMKLPVSGGILASALPSRARSMSSMLGFKEDPHQPPGLGNRDNSCFQNSVLQGLASLQTLPDYLGTCAELPEVEEADKEVAQTLRTLMADLTDGKQNGKTIWTPHKLRFMSTWSQQDAQEYYSKVLDDIDKCVAKAVKARKKSRGFESDSSKDSLSGSQHSEDSGYQSGPVHSRSIDTTPTRNPLEGLLAQRVACMQCGYSDGLSMIPFNCLTLSLGLDSGTHDLYERLDAYSHVEPIEGVECTMCTLLRAKSVAKDLVTKLSGRDGMEAALAMSEQRLKAIEDAIEDDDFKDETIKEKCKISEKQRVTSTKTKQVVIARPPQSLVVHMNRSVFDPSTFHMMKNSAPVNFPMTLDLGPWCLGSKHGSNLPLDGQDGSQTLNHDVDEERWASHPKHSMIAGDQDASRLSGPIYELRAIVTHAGRHENGHYVCYRKHPSAGVPTQVEDDGDAKSLPLPDEMAGAATAGEGKELNEEAADPATEEEQQQANEAVSPVDTSDSQWWRLSDEAVHKVQDDYVLNQGSGVFMLFYECVDPTMVLNNDPSPEQSDAGGSSLSSPKLEPKSEPELPDPEPVTPRQRSGFFEHILEKPSTSAMATPELTDEDSGVETAEEEAGMPATPGVELEREETVRAGEQVEEEGEEERRVSRLLGLP